MDPNLDPSVFAQGFSQEVCDQFYAVGQEAKRKGEKPLDPDEIEQQVRLLSELVKSKGLTPNEDTIRKYIECSMAGYDGSEVPDGTPSGDESKLPPGTTLLTQPFSQEVCETYYLLGKDVRERNLDAHVVEIDVDKICATMQAEGLICNRDTIKRYRQCVLAGYNGEEMPTASSSSWLWFGATVAVVGAALWFGTRE